MDYCSEYIGRLIRTNYRNRIDKAFIVKNSSEINFPNLSRPDLEILMCGSYQLKQSFACAIEHLKQNGVFIVEMHESLKICRIKIHSWHSNSKHYKAYTEYDPNESGLRSIVSYACNC